ncbi:MAG TPA: hypothetical protein VFT29_08825 [Gemmatimonadaceae bacterium]|nr:hypothetical protein [Gemmatimonadaceae bacterium]
MTSRMHSVLTSTCAALVMVACGDTTSPIRATTRFVQAVSLNDLETALDGATFVKIAFTTPTGLVARQIEVEADQDDETIASRVTAINTVDETVTLELGGLVVRYTSNTRFRTPTSSDVALVLWEQFVQNEISNGRNPPIEARRHLPLRPRAPTIALFTATDLRITNDLDEARIEVLVDADNLEQATSSPSLAILRVFNLPFEITAQTELERVVEGQVSVGSVVEFEAEVVAADAATRTLLLAGGTIIKISSATTVDPNGDLVTFAAVVTAKNSGKFVHAEGRGRVDSAGVPVTITATTVKVDVDD